MNNILKTLLIILLFISCKSYDQKQLIGKWQNVVNGYEIWFFDSLALGYNNEFDSFYLYRYKIDNDKIQYELIDGETANNPKYSVKIKSLEQDILTTYYLGDAHPDYDRKITMKRLSDKLPIVYHDLIKNRNEYEMEFRKSAKSFFENK